VLNTPHNPTGSLMPRDDYERLHRIVRERKLLLFSDEVYRESELDPADRLPAASDLGEHAVSLGVMSKTYGLAGLRIGWVATRNCDVLRRMAALKDYTTICNSAPSEMLAELALHHRDKLIQRNVDIIRNNAQAFDRFVGGHLDHFSWVCPRGGSMGFPRLLQGSVEEFCDRLVREAGVLLLPGSVYADSGNHFRVGLGRRNFPQALERLADFLPHWSPAEAA
jgi:aspartate/methionine/tyrosine aminotransferase